MAMDRRDIDAELGRVTADFHRLLDSATPAELGMPTNGTKWTNKQLLFRMLFGFIVVRVLLLLVKAFGRLPPAASRTFAAILNAGTRPFHTINYLSALPGGTVLSSRVMARLMDSTIPVPATASPNRPWGSFQTSRRRSGRGGWVLVHAPAPRAPACPGGRLHPSG
jgi:hypothetical protein